MEEFVKIIIWIVLIVIFLVSRFKKKPEQTQPQRPQQRQPNPQNRQKEVNRPRAETVSDPFQDFLKQFEQEKQKVEKEKRKIEQKNQRREQVVEEPTVTQESKWGYDIEKEQNIVKNHFEKYQKYNETQDMETGKYESGQYHGGDLEFNYPPEEEKVNPYKEAFANPETVKQAIVMAEIMKRKY
jgi:hypothetical protein